MKGWDRLKISPSGELYLCESDIQISCVNWFRTVHSKLAINLFAIPNGSQMTGKKDRSGIPIQAKRMKAEGMTSGVSDLMLAFPCRGFAGLFIEMKTPVGSLSKDQKAFLSRMAADGYAVAVCRSLDEFERVVNKYLFERFIQAPVWVGKRETKKAA